MSHYKSNLRDLEFNLFEVFGADAAFGQGPYADLDADTARSILGEVDRLAREDLAASYADGDRNPPVFDPHDPHRAAAGGVQASPTRRSWTPSSGASTCPRRSAARTRRGSLWWALAELVLGVQRRRSGCTPPARPSRTRCTSRAPSEQKKWAKLFVDKRWGSTMVLTEPDAGSDVGAGRTRAIPQPDGTWHIEGVKRFITVRRARPDRQHHPLRAGPPGRRRGRRRPGHQGPVAVRRAEVPLRRGDRRAGRAQRRLRHQRRAQDGPQGLQHLRADLRRARQSRPRAGCSATCTRASGRCS